MADTIRSNLCRIGIKNQADLDRLRNSSSPDDFAYQSIEF